MSVQIVEVKTKAQRRLFVDFPNQLYRDVPQFVPAFYGDDLDDWDPEKNPAFSYCEARAFLAYRDGEIVGRIGAILSKKSNETWNQKRMRFSQVDFIDDREVSKALFQTVEVDGTPAAFLIALREGLADYWSENYKWFSSQYPSFLYVDRIVIDEPFRRLGLGQKLYEGVFARASEAGLPVVTAEVDIEPVYNDASIRFHEAMGFEEVGQQIIRGGSIKVSLRAKTL